MPDLIRSVSFRRRPHGATFDYDSAISVAVAWTLCVLLVYGLVLLQSAIRLSTSTFDRVFAEGGLVETATICAWLALAMILLARDRRADAWRRMLLPALCLAAAAREADWHKQFTGESMLKVSYHLAPGPLLDRAVAALAFLCVLFLLGHALARLFRFWRDGGLRQPAGQMLAIGIALFIATKVFDRAPELVEWALSVDVSFVARRITQAFEEGFEFGMAVVFLEAALRASRDAPAPVPASAPA